MVGLVVVGLVGAPGEGEVVGLVVVGLVGAPGEGEVVGLVVGLVGDPRGLTPSVSVFDEIESTKLSLGSLNSAPMS